MIEPAISILENNNFKVSVANQVYEKNGQSAGTIDKKIDALHNAFLDTDIDIVLCACGGNGAIHLMDHIDFNIIKNNPKPFIGFSDITILLNAIYKETGLITFHGPTATKIKPSLPHDQLNQLLTCLAGENQVINWNNCLVTNPKQAQGILIGGNLSIFQTLLGTKYLPRDEQVILFLEDIGDEISRYDRMLAHIKQSELFDRTSAILFGDFSHTNNNVRVPFGKNMDQVIDELTSDLDIPIIKNCPFGHRYDLWTLPIGKKCNLDIQDNIVTLNI